MLGVQKPMKRLSLSLALAVTLGAASLFALQPKQTLSCNDRGGDHRLANFCEMREQTVAAAGGTISVDALQNGGISIKGWDRADVLVRAQVRTAAPTDAEARDLARQVNVQTGGAQIKADGPRSENDHSWSVSYEVFVPTRSSASLRTVNGGVSVADVTGNLDFQVVNGGVSLARVNGYVHGRTVNGGLHIQLDGPRWEGQGMDVSTTNGGVTLSVPQNYSAQLDAQTNNGGVHSDLPMVSMASNRQDRHITAALGSGGATLKITTVNGGVSIKRI
jgi:DUF4097 and DUF4098 domain-containing protein YvlB